VSRSYRKVLSDYSEIWTDDSFRTRNRLCIHREMRNPDYGDVVFPIRKECFDIIRCKNFELKKETRDKYFLEIRNILNGFRDWDAGFIELCDIIKGILPDIGGNYGHEWLNSKRVKKAIKTWSGKPLKVLKYLTDNGLIEQAVRLKIKLSIRK